MNYFRVVAVVICAIILSNAQINAMQPADKAVSDLVTILGIVQKKTKTLAAILVQAAQESPAPAGVAFNEPGENEYTDAKAEKDKKAADKAKKDTDKDKKHPDKDKNDADTKPASTHDKKHPDKNKNDADQDYKKPATAPSGTPAGNPVEAAGTAAPTALYTGTTQEYFDKLDVLFKKYVQ